MLALLKNKFTLTDYYVIKISSSETLFRFGKTFPTKSIFKLGFSWICLRKSVKCKMHFNIFIKNARFIRKQFMWLLMCYFYKLVKFICLLYSMKFEINMRIERCRRSKLCLIYKGIGKGQENEKKLVVWVQIPFCQMCYHPLAQSTISKRALRKGSTLLCSFAITWSSVLQFKTRRSGRVCRAIDNLRFWMWSLLRLVWHEEEEK